MPHMILGFSVVEPTEFQLLNDAIQQAGNKCLSAATPTRSVQQA